ncbi:MAG: DUF4384 domain-containing protein [Meiothermus sp.]|nr:DUF4384 domain-containing protein [Meiothermus sp.]
MRLFALLTLALLAGCVPASHPNREVGLSAAQRSQFALSSVVTQFAPDRGQGGEYRLRERVFFSFTLSRPGYITLVTVDPDSTTVVLERNVPLAAGRHTLPLASDRNAQGQATYLVLPPAGPQFFRLIYTDVAVNQRSLFDGKLSREELNTQTRTYTASAALKDVADTSLEVVGR